MSRLTKPENNETSTTRTGKGSPESKSTSESESAPEAECAPKAEKDTHGIAQQGIARFDQPAEIGGQKGPEPTRYGDWEKNGRCTDF